MLARRSLPIPVHFLTSRSRSWRLAAISIWTAWLATYGASPAAAQAPMRQDRSFSPQLFHPAVGPDEFFTVEPAQPLPHLNYSLGLWLNYARDEFVISNVTTTGTTTSISGVRAKVIDNALGGDLVFSIGLVNRLQLGILVPLTIYQSGDSVLMPMMGPSIALNSPRSAFALGDPQINVKVRLWGKDRGPNLSAAVFMSVPASGATPNNFGGQAGDFTEPMRDAAGNITGYTVTNGVGISAGGKLLFGWEGERWRAGLSFGGFWRQHQSTFFSSQVGSQLNYGVAFGYDVIAKRKLTLVGEVYGRADLQGTHISNIDANPLEIDVGVKYRFIRSLSGTLGLGTGVVSGLGAPLVRVFAGIVYSPDRRDRDKDGVPDQDDRCPDVAEDRDGFQDEDGCPDPDNDGDGIPDAVDKCPNEAEDFDGFQDQDGCREPDNDGDGIPDIKDNCPMDKEDGKQPKPDDGCPADKVDSDDDGIPDIKDKCPLDPEDKDGFQDEDGCPDVDNDEDGVPDGFDKCPNEPEDKDGFEDDDGCPDPDNDKDGIPDIKDKCPNEPETINGYQDEDGCPDKGPSLKVQIVGDEIVILEKVRFKTGKATIDAKSFNLLEQVTSILKIHGELKKVQIDGHTDSKGKRPKNVKLSQDRADAVMRFLVAHGINAGRLSAMGFGPDKPVAENKTERGRESNRRVEFHITEKAAPLNAPAPVEPAPEAAPDAAPVAP